MTEPDANPVPAATGRETPDAQAPFDLFVSGTVFLDIIFTGLHSPPVGGQELMSTGMGSSPGGAANLAVAGARLGLNTSLTAAFGSDHYGDYCWSILEEGESIDLSYAKRFDDWHSPVTVSLAYDNDRAMVTHAHPPPTPPDDLVADPPRTRACFADMGGERPEWVDSVVANGTLVFADIGWDETGAWDHDALRRRLDGCHAFVPNADEAMSFTGTDSPGAALEAMRDWVPLAVVTAGSGGAFAADATTDETAWVPGVNVTALDPTGAGDVFLAALMYGTIAEWPLARRLRFANLCAALSVRDFGGALAAPGWGDVCDWWVEARKQPRLARDFAFLENVLATVEHHVFERAVPTIGFHYSTEEHGRHGPRPTAPQRGRA